MVLGSDCQIRATFRDKVMLCHKMRVSATKGPLRAKPREILETNEHKLVGEGERLCDCHIFVEIDILDRI